MSDPGPQPAVRENDNDSHRRCHWWGSGKSGRNGWHSVKLNTLGFKVLRRKTPAHRLIINNMISISLDLKPRVSESYSIFSIRTSVDLC